MHYYNEISLNISIQTFQEARLLVIVAIKQNVIYQRCESII